MKALFLRDNQQLSLEETERPVIQDQGDTLVRVTASAICGSDVHFWKGEAPYIPNFILGHEFIGIIEEAGSEVENFKPGDRVAVPAAPYCGSCSECRQGKYYQCKRTVMFGWQTPKGYLPGGQAEYVRVPFSDACLVPIPDSVTDKQALLTGDILSTAYFGVTNGNLQPGDDIAIFGAGPVGLCAVACARLFTPGRIILVDYEDYRLEKGAQLGADVLLNPSRDKAVSQIKFITRGKGVQVAVDAVGLPSTLDDCIRALTPGGILSAVGVGPQSFPVAMGKMFTKNLTLKSGFVPLSQMDRLMKLIELGKLDVNSIITHEIKIDQIIEGYQMFANKEDGCIKVMINLN